MRHTSLRTGLALLIAASACGSDVAAPSIMSLEGDWSRLGQVPGSSEHWSLVLTGTTVQGTGTWSGEACCSGPLSIVGTIVGDSLHADITMVVTIGNPAPNRHEHFDGRLMSATELRGIATLDGGLSGTIQFRKE
jgi:hypothetical protein